LLLKPTAGIETRKDIPSSLDRNNLERRCELVVVLVRQTIILKSLDRKTSVIDTTRSIAIPETNRLPVKVIVA
jgi:hypothetical protein